MAIEMKDVVEFFESDDPYALMIVEAIGELAADREYNWTKSIAADAFDDRSYDNIRKEVVEEMKTWRWNYAA